MGGGEILRQAEEMLPILRVFSYKTSALVSAALLLGGIGGVDGLRLLQPSFHSFVLPLRKFYLRTEPLQPRI